MPSSYMGETRSQKHRAKTEKKKSTTSKVVKWLLIGAILAVLATNIFTHVVQIVNYSGTGMEPSLQSGQTLVILKNNEVAEGDIVAFYYNNQVLVRRVICEGGKQIEIDENGLVLVNGEEISEPYVKDPALGQCNITFPYHVRAGTYFVMGDNRIQAMDSRLTEIGSVPKDRIIGKVIFQF